MVSDQADKISPINEISMFGFSAITQVQTSIPAAIAAGDAATKGSATR